MSTNAFQDVQTSRAWQRAVSVELIEGVGSVVAEFFDVGVSRRWSWLDRPKRRRCWPLPQTLWGARILHTRVELRWSGTVVRSA
ncbi:hypothetical protein BBK82_35960 [Lentzea guizhouensis]|uniref:Uncharacterized protein n=2 Tax=Lentzea guizhouensis TaxID=1586287 RepID=A0A1B2HS84_9PSEU|nr:hypothetical protein BBK82_35960 [Lentzea guizhouensis]